MSNIHNFTNRQLCEYASIFPTVAALLDHMLFTIGNGYEFKGAMIVDAENTRIDRYPVVQDWDTLIKACHEKERRFALKYARDGEIDEEQLAKDCAIYGVVSVSDEQFTEEALLADLLKMQAERRKGSMGDHFLRPYPLAKNYSDIYSINKKTPEWFVQIAINLCNAWITFLTQAIETNDVWVKPSLRPKKPGSEALAKAWAELMGEIKSDKQYDGWLDNQEEPERDYGDMEYTVLHRDMLVSRVAELNKLIGK